MSELRRCNGEHTAKCQNALSSWLRASHSSNTAPQAAGSQLLLPWLMVITPVLSPWLRMVSTRSSRVTTMCRGMFAGASAFDQPLSFDTSRVTTMNALLLEAKAVNPPLSFDTSRVTEMGSQDVRLRDEVQPAAHVSFDTSRVTHIWAPGCSRAQRPCLQPTSCSSAARGQARRPSPLLAMARAGLREAALRRRPKDERQGSGRDFWRRGSTGEKGRVGRDQSGSYTKTTEPAPSGTRARGGRARSARMCARVKHVSGKFVTFPWTGRG